MPLPRVRTKVPPTPSGLAPWLPGAVPPTRQGALRSVQLDNLGALPQMLAGYSATMHCATTQRPLWQQLSRRAWTVDPQGWATRYEAVVYQKFVDVPIFAVLGPPRHTGPGINRNQFRKAQPFVRAQGLATALAQSASAILRSRGANG